LISKYIYYIRRELHEKRGLFWEKIKAVEREYGNDKLYPQTNIQLKEIYKQNGK
jgi:hypothetical protein